MRHAPSAEESLNNVTAVYEGSLHTDMVPTLATIGPTVAPSTGKADPALSLGLPYDRLGAPVCRAA